MDQAHLTETIIKNLTEHCIQDIRQDPKRGIRRCVDLGLYFSKGRFQKQFFTLFTDLLSQEDSHYYDLVLDLVNTINRQQLQTLGINIGYHAWTQGAKQLRLDWAHHQHALQWTLICPLDDEETFDAFRHRCREVYPLGICTYILFSKRMIYENQLITLTQTYPHASFWVFIEESDTLVKGLDLLAHQANVMLIFNSQSPSARKNVQTLRASHILSAYSFYYDDRLTDLDFECLIQDYRPFLFLVPRPEASENFIHHVDTLILKARLSQDKSAFVFHLYEDIQRISAIIMSQ